MLDIRDKPAFLLTAMRLLAGKAHISMEGNLVDFDLSSIAGASGDETRALRRQTILPRQDFVVLPLEPESINPIVGLIPPARLVKDVEHIQIEKNGQLELGIYDNFDPESSWAGEVFSSELLDQLKAKGVLRDWQPAE